MAVPCPWAGPWIGIVRWTRAATRSASSAGSAPGPSIWPTSSGCFCAMVGSGASVMSLPIITGRGHCRPMAGNWHGPRASPFFLVSSSLIMSLAIARTIFPSNCLEKEPNLVPEPLRCLPESAVITGWDFSTGGVKCLAFDLGGNTIAEARLPTDLWTKGGVSELNVMQLEGQARSSVRAMASKLRELGRLNDWLAGGISATHHTAARIDRNRNQVRRAICWNDQTSARYHQRGLERLGGQGKVRELIGGPWASRYSLSHLVKDEDTLSLEDWQRTERILPHGPLAAGFLTGNFDVTSLSAAASTGICDLRTSQWRQEMLEALANPELRHLAWQQLPRIIDHQEPIGPLSDSLALEAGIDPEHPPLIFPTSDDQQAGLVGGGAVDAGQVAIILGNSAVVNSSSATLPDKDNLDAMR